MEKRCWTSTLKVRPAVPRGLVRRVPIALPSARTRHHMGASGGVRRKSISLTKTRSNANSGRAAKFVLLHCIIASMVPAKCMEPILVTTRDPFLSSVIAQTALHRLLGVAVVLVVLWLAIGWAVSLP